MSTLFLNGELLDISKKKFSPSLFSLNYSICAFEGIRSYQCQEGDTTSIFRLENHINRMISSMEYLHMQSEFMDKRKMLDAICSTVSANGGGDLYIRPIAFFDEGIMSVKVLPDLNFSIMAFPFKKKLPLDSHKLFLSKVCSDVSTQNFKISRNYFGSYMALKSVGEMTDSYEVIQYTKDRLISETSAHNIFLKMRNGDWFTPKTSLCLPGITRDTAIQLFREMSIDIVPEDIHIEQLADVDSCFITSTAGEIINVSHIENRELNSSCEEIKQLIGRYRSIVTSTSDQKSKEWNTYV